MIRFWRHTGALCFGMCILVAQVPTPKHPLDQALDRCLASHPGTTSERHCVEHMMPQWDKALNQAYTALGGDQNPELRRSQVAWLKFRDAEYKYIDKRFGYEGTMYLLMAAHARLLLLRQRTLDLQAQVEFQKLHQ